jgi:putative ABC transport system permease protein
MMVWKMCWQNLKTKPLYTVLSVFSLALSIALLLAMQQFKTSITHQIENNLGNIDLVVGAKGSPLQLVLSSVLHLDNPTGNMSYKEALKIGKTPSVKLAVPISYGDNYKGFRIVGTINSFRQLYDAKLEKGREVNSVLEAVIGHTVAKQLKLSIGDTFVSAHGLLEASIETHDEKFVVVGILKPTHKVIDRLILCDLESIWHVHKHGKAAEGQHQESIPKNTGDSHDKQHEVQHKGHDIEQHHEHFNEDKQITSLLVSFRSPTGFLMLPRRINEGTNLQAALPKYELDQLYKYTGVGVTAIKWIAYLILVISGLTIGVSLYKMVKERAFDLALLRTYGATHFQVVKIVVYEGLIIISIAFVIAIVLVTLALPALLNSMEIQMYVGILKPLALEEALKLSAIVFTILTFSILIAVYPITKMKISEVLSNEY